MNNPFQDQLLKAGIATKQQVQKANQEKNKKKKKQRNTKGPVVDKVKLKIEQAAKEKEKRDLELNKVKEEAVRKKAISVEINQLITENCIARKNDCEIVYNFEHNKKVKRIYVNAEMKQQVIKGKLGIARVEGRYELVPLATARKIQQRNANRVVIFDAEQELEADDDTYSEYQIPDDLMW